MFRSDLIFINDIVMNLGAKHYAGWVSVAKLSHRQTGNLTLDNMYKTETRPGMD